jgi:hypothetical protein
VTYGITSIPNIKNFRLFILYLLNTYERASYLKKVDLGWLGYVRLGYVRLGMRMRRRSRIMASSTFHLTISSNHVLGITECIKLRSRIQKRGLRHNIHIKYQEFLPIHSVVIKYIRTGITSEEVGLGLVGLG